MAFTDGLRSRPEPPPTRWTRALRLELGLSLGGLAGFLGGCLFWGLARLGLVDCPLWVVPGVLGISAAIGAFWGLCSFACKDAPLVMLAVPLAALLGWLAAALLHAPFWLGAALAVQGVVLSGREDLFLRWLVYFLVAAVGLFMVGVCPALFGLMLFCYLAVRASHSLLG